MTVTGFILSGVFSDIPESAACQGLLCDFAEKTLYDNKISDVKIIESGSLFQSINSINNNEDSRFVLLSRDAEIDRKEDLSSDFCMSENIKYVTESGQLLGAFLVSPIEFSEILSIKKTRVLKATKITAANFGQILTERRNEIYKKLCSNNVYLESTQNICISPLSDIGSGSFIGNGSFIKGKSKIGKNCMITGMSRISDSDIGDNTSVLSAVILNSTIGENVSVGPFAYIRPGSYIADRVKVGDFVEIKNSKIDSGTKISHLTYVGDSDVGYGVNFGCGTITVNYDGLKKHRTVIGNNVFIGCNTNLVAPVEVGDNAFIAAGSTITDEIPPKSFAIARQRQITKENYVENKMPDMIKE